MKVFLNHSFAFVVGPNEGEDLVDNIGFNIFFLITLCGCNRAISLFDGVIPVRVWFFFLFGLFLFLRNLHWYRGTFLNVVEAFLILFLFLNLTLHEFWFKCGSLLWFFLELGVELELVLKLIWIRIERKHITWVPETSCVICCNVVGIEDWVVHI